MFVRLNCYKNADWPNEKKDEIDKAIKKCLEVFVLFCLLSNFKKFVFSRNFYKLFPKENNHQQ